MESEENKIDKAKEILRQLHETMCSGYTLEELISKVIAKDEWDEGYVTIIKKEIQKRYKLYANN